MLAIETIETSDGGKAYLVADEATREAVLIDPGDAFSQISDAAKRLKLKIKAILLTAGDLRHAARAAEARFLFGAPVCAHQDQLVSLRDLPSKADRLGMCGVKVPPVERFLKEGDEVQFGTQSVRIHEMKLNRSSILLFEIEGFSFDADKLSVSPRSRKRKRR